MFAGAPAVADWAVPWMSGAWFYHRDSAAELEAPSWYGPVMTLVTFGCSMVLVACFSPGCPIAAPGSPCWARARSTATCCTGFVAQGSKFWGWYEPAWVHRPLGEIVVTVAAAVLVTVLCTPPVRRVFRWVMEPDMAWAFRRDVRDQARERNAVRA
ncbi:hypothetical protein HDC93_003588 [Streptomyces sp. AK010]|nr:hypothetical protein [Streptomyces sp. AK010]